MLFQKKFSSELNMDGKWQIYQNFYFEILLNESFFRTFCNECFSDLITEEEVCTLLQKLTMKFITDIFDELHFIKSDLVQVMILAIKNYILLSNTILLKKNETICRQWAELIMDRIIFDYTGENFNLATLPNVICDSFYLLS
jgi:ribonucleotide reductase beta subunit family protein with ferritin-like domain